MPVPLAVRVTPSRLTRTCALPVGLGLRGFEGGHPILVVGGPTCILVQSSNDGECRLTFASVLLVVVEVVDYY